MGFREYGDRESTLQAGKKGTTVEQLGRAPNASKPLEFVTVPSCRDSTRSGDMTTCTISLNQRASSPDACYGVIGLYTAESYLQLFHHLGVDARCHSLPRSGERRFFIVHHDVSDKIREIFLKTRPLHKFV